MEEVARLKKRLLLPWSFRLSAQAAQAVFHFWIVWRRCSDIAQRAHKFFSFANNMRGGMNMHTQKSSRRSRFALGFLLVWALAVLALMLINALKPEPRPAYDGATFVRMEAGRSCG